ncbi:hypothetical protein QOZ80_7AG0554870 [Eleusine coracana subsp. coracana]|nr:hypothetical protein QOZ80_7AG0554870 [Eleusine coracana subsp. coracana]
MSRRPRRSGTNFIENERDRNLTYFKRRSGLYKSATDLTTLTGAKVAIVVEAESGKKSAFGIPSANPIIESFLAQRAPVDPLIDEEEAARITYLQDKLFRLEKDKTVEQKRAKDTKAHLKEILENSGEEAKLLSDEVEDLGADELNKLFQKLALVQVDVNHQVNANNHFFGQGNPPHPLSSPPWLSQIRVPPRHLPWAPLQESSQSSRSYSSLIYPAIQPLEYAQSTQPLHHHQTHMMPPQSNEAHQYGYYLPQEEPPLLPPQLDLDQNYAYAHNVDFNPMPPPDQNHAYTHNFDFNLVAPPQADQHANSQYFAAYGQPYDGYYWPPLSPCNESYIDALSAYLGLTGDNGDQAVDDQDNVHGPPDDDQHQQGGDDLLNINLWDYSPFRDDGAAN